MLSRRRLTFDIEEPHALIHVVKWTRQNFVHRASELDPLTCASLMAWLTSRLQRCRLVEAKTTGFGIAIVSDE
jgi:hypothetical protein